MVFKLTIGQYITRNGKEINHIGLTPDEYVENTVGKIDTSKYTQFDFETKSALGNSSDNVKAAKERLSLMGYYSGDTESPVFDENFKDALKSFQQVNEIFSYGVLDVPTQKRMEEVFADLDAVSDNQFDTAYELLLKRQK
jgi:carboxyl-terminal processing protease